MNDDSIDEILSLKRRAEALRNNDKFERALDVLDEVINRLENLKLTAAGDEQMLNKINSGLADTHGMKGGVYRRLKNYHAALNEYRNGVELETKDTLSTYNLGNEIVLSIMLRESSLDDEFMRYRLSTAIDRLEKQMASERSDEWWAWADLGQFHLLNGQVEAAREAYAKGRETGPSSAEYQRSLDVLEDIAVAIKQDWPDQSVQIESFVREMRATF